MIQKTKNKIFVFFGILSVIAGFIGALLPIVPTTPFLILAAYLFSKGSPELHQWIRNHGKFGASVRDWEDHKVIKPSAKIMATVAMIFSFGYIQFFTEKDIRIKILLTIVEVLIIGFVLTRKSRKS